MSGIMHALIYKNMGAVFTGPGGGGIIVNEKANVILHDEFVANGWDGVSIINTTYEINVGAAIYSTSSGVPALRTGYLPPGSTVTVINNGLIVGKGGKGGDTLVLAAGSNGASGGNAITATSAITLINNGTIAGGGGGGGGGGSDISNFDSSPFNRGYGGGTGGGGIGNGATGVGTKDPLLGGVTYYGYHSGRKGSLVSAGLGGTAYDRAGAGGSGGGYGQPGAGGTSNNPRGTNPFMAGGAGGAAGSCIVGDSNITWTTVGARYGAIIP